MVRTWSHNCENHVRPAATLIAVLPCRGSHTHHCGSDMTVELLIQSIVHQTTILIAQLATSGGARAPLAQVANQVFLDLVAELERQGISRKVSADMFGLGLRTYQRKIQRLLESTTERGRSLWEVVLDFVCSQKLVTRASVQMRFASDDDALVRGVLRDLCENGLIFSSGQGPSTVYRAASNEEVSAVQKLRTLDGLDELLWAIIYREGPATRDELVDRTHLEAEELDAALSRLVAEQRIELARDPSTPKYRSHCLWVPVGAPVGWEAAVFDHFQAMVKTICCKLRDDRATAATQDVLGGSTYTLDIWPGHPLEEEARMTLSRLRSVVVDLRKRVESVNLTEGVPENYSQLILYVGQCQIDQERDDSDHA